MNEPKISIIMPAYNSGKYIEEAILSILNQTFKDFELIIIDDCSEDNTRQIIDKYSAQDPRIVSIKNPKRVNHVATINIGLAAARGIYVAKLDADDVALPKRLEIQYDYMNSHPNIALVGGAAILINEQGIVFGHKYPYEDFNLIKYRMLLRNPIIHPTIFFKKDIVKKLGGYEQDYLHAEDYRLYYRLIQAGYLLANIPEQIIKYRRHSKSITGLSESRSIQLDNTYRITSEYINKYFPASDEKIIKVLDNIRMIDTDLFSILNTLFFYKKLTTTFINKENISQADSKKIWKIYKSDKKELLSNYLKTRLPLVYSTIKTFKDESHT